MNDVLAKLIYLPFDEVTKSSGIVQAYHDYWWIVDREKGLVFYSGSRHKLLKDSSPQCNRDQSTAHYLLGKLYLNTEFIVQQIPLVLCPINLNDY
jgi:hypothetical protein